jgi:septum formation protein
MNNSAKIVLGSSSPRRRLLLESLGFNIEIIKPDCDEIFPVHLKNQEIPVYLSKKKAESISNNFIENKLLITADTIVWFNNRVMNKPENVSEAKNMLETLSGNTHFVYTGVCIKQNNKTITFFDTSEVTFRKLNKHEIDYYVTNFMPLDKAGSYGAQECLPENYNPCSIKETEFIQKNNLEKLIDVCKPSSEIKNIDLIKNIKGSYFNVMGFPVVEFMNILSEWPIVNCQ